MATDDNLTGRQGVQKLQNIRHAKAKEEPNRRFHALSDKVWRMDFLTQAWKQVRHNGGVPGLAEYCVISSQAVVISASKASDL